MEAKIKALEIELSEEKQMRQDKEQEVGQLSTILFKSLSRKLQLVNFVKPNRALFEPNCLEPYSNSERERKKLAVAYLRLP